MKSAFYPRSGHPSLSDGCITRPAPSKPSNSRSIYAICLALSIGWLAAAPVLADPTAASSSEPHDFTSLSLEELMNYPVTTVSRHAEKLVDAPAAVYVITSDDIRRSGVTSIPEALRLAPGLDVARVDSHDWAISARGFNDLFANKLLVLMDGRSVYTPLFSGVFWDVQDTLLEDIDRIEVIRGPGATLWGANAVNGVINIISKSAKDTAIQGEKFLLLGGGGTEEQGFAGFRYSDKVGQNLYLRLYGKYFNRDNSVLPDGSEAYDRWQASQGGFRLDWGDAAGPKGTDLNLLTLQGDIYDGTIRAIYNVPTTTPPYVASLHDIGDIKGGNVLGRWSHEFSDDSDLKAQFYYDRTFRDTVIFGEDLDTFDFDLQHRFPLGDRNDFTWGAGYRAYLSEVKNTPTVALFPDQRGIQLFSAFVQDRIVLVPNRLSLTLGSKFEHNDFTGFEYQPSARFLWTPTSSQSVWASVARAVRTPSLAEENVRLNAITPIPGVVSSFLGSGAFDSEKLLAYELGYRVQPHPKLSADLALFYNDYSDLRTVEPQHFTLGPPPIYVPFLPRNNMHGDTYGFEITPSWQVLEGWRLQASYSFLEMYLRTDSSSFDTISTAQAGQSPRHQVSLRSSLDLPHNIQFDAWLRYVDRLPALDIPSYVTADLRLGWRPCKNLELSIVGQNLLQDRHLEFKSSFINTPLTEVPRSVYGKVTLRF